MNGVMTNDFAQHVVINHAELISITLALEIVASIQKMANWLQ
jgi:hypothetical protein